MGEHSEGLLSAVKANSVPPISSLIGLDLPGPATQGPVNRRSSDLWVQRLGGNVWRRFSRRRCSKKRDWVSAG